jgi:hypothetical protein
MLELANSLGMSMHMAKREDTLAPIPVPALIHWKAGHFAAIVKEEGGRYLVQDATFGEELWVSRKALDLETSGYALVKAGPFAAGWRPVAAEEGARSWQGSDGSERPQCQTCQTTNHGGGGCPGKCPGGPNSFCRCS